jgi:hypothetical protein
MPIPSWISLTTQQQDELLSYQIAPGWRVLQQASLPSCYSTRLIPKLDSGLLIVSPVSTGQVMLVINNYRVDLRTRKIDQQPFGVVVYTTGIGSVACFVHHGDWANRSIEPPEDFWTRVEESGVGNYFYSAAPQGRLAATGGTPT